MLAFAGVLAGCADDDAQMQRDALRDALAAANSESAALRASSRVLQTRLTATQNAARGASARVVELNSVLEQLKTAQAALGHSNAQGSERLRAAESAIAHYQGGLAAASQALHASESRNAALARQLAAVSGWLGQRDALGQSQNNTLNSMASDLQQRSTALAASGKQIDQQKKSLQLATAQADQLRATNAQLGAQLKQAQLENATNEQRVRGAQQASDAVDETLASTAKELESERAEQRLALMRIEQALQLSLEESRVLEQRERGLREQLALTQQTSVKRIDEVRARLTAALQTAEDLNAQSKTLEGKTAYLQARNDDHIAQTEAVRAELAAKINAAQVAAKACVTASQERAAVLGDLQAGNESLTKEVATLNSRLRALEAVQSECKLQKTAL